jgi:hypothetical protein
MGTDVKETGGATDVAIKPGAKASKVAAALTETDEVSSAALTALEAAKDAVVAEGEDIEPADDNSHLRQGQFYEQAGKRVDEAIKEVTAALTEAAAKEEAA